MAYSYLYPRPAVTVDSVVFTLNQKILLIKRKNDPFKNQWALPGGFIDMEETALQSAQRELEEESGINTEDLFPLGFYDTPQRDPRGRTISLAFWTIIPSELSLKAGDDAKEANWFMLNDLPALAFDHKEIIQDGIDTLKETIKCEPDFLPYLLHI
jgi:8-oxo-dGTP diphosphatase